MADDRDVILKTGHVNHPSGCDLCGAMRAAGYDRCEAHPPVRWDWKAAGHASPHDAAFAHLVRLDEALEREPHRPAACAGALSLWFRRFLDREAVALESSALGVDRTRLDLQLFLADYRRGGTA